jgi:RNA polymerase sigma-70 factor (ECF subfamily)
MVSDGGAREKVRREPGATPPGPAAPRSSTPGSSTPRSSAPRRAAPAPAGPDPAAPDFSRPDPSAPGSGRAGQVVGPGRSGDGQDGTGGGMGGDDGDGGTSLRPQILALLPDLRAFARFLARDRTLADDLVQETLVRALGALGQFQPGTNLKAWLFTIERNAFFEHARRRRREDVAMRGHFADGEAEGPAQHGAADLSDLGRMLFSLPPLLREALVLVGAQELSHDEAAAICGVPVGTMKARVSRARSKLAQITGRGAVQEPDA